MVVTLATVAVRVVSGGPSNVQVYHISKRSLIAIIIPQSVLDRTGDLPSLPSHNICCLLSRSRKILDHTCIKRAAGKLDQLSTRGAGGSF